MTKLLCLKYLLGVAVVVGIELITHAALPVLQHYKSAHLDGMDWLPLVYVVVLVSSLVLHFVNVWKYRFNSTSIILVGAVLAILHTSYLVLTVKCSCGEP